MFRPLGSAAFAEAVCGATGAASGATGAATKIPRGPQNASEVGRIIIAIAEQRFSQAPVGISRNVTEQIIGNSGVEAVSVHRAGQRGMGLTRRAKLTPAQKAANPWHSTGKERRWKAPEFKDFNGDWCDRVLLGQRRVRVGVLCPYDLGCTAESLQTALSAHPAVEPHHVLVVTPGLDLELGKLRLQSVANVESARWLGSELVDSALSSRFGASGAPYCLEVGVAGSSPMSTLSEGSGSEDMGAAFETAFDDSELSHLHDTTFKIAAFTAALWADDPGTAMSFANRSRHAATEDARKQWSTLQACLPPFEDEQVITAYMRNKTVGPLTPSTMQERIDIIVDKRMAQQRRLGEKQAFVKNEQRRHRR
jgi:hypothetical protein